MSKAPKPRFSSGTRMRVQADGRSSTHAEHGDPTQVVRTGERKEALSRRIIRNVLGGVATLFILGLAVYTILALTVLVVMPADDKNAVVLRGAFPIGQAPEGAYVYAGTAEVDHSLIGKAEQATVGVPAGSVVRIVTGPYNEISTDEDGYIVSDGERTDFQGKVDAQVLSGQYVAICIAGACEEGKAVLVDEDTIVGEVKGYLTTGGLEDPTTPTPSSSGK